MAGSLMETSPIIRFSAKITDTIWSSPRYHGRDYEYKISPVAIIFAHR